MTWQNIGIAVAFILMVALPLYAAMTLPEGKEEDEEE